MSFLPSLTHTGTRVGGQRERATQAFEAGCTHFPRDYPCTQAYDALADERAIQEEDKWTRKPPAKRPNYAKIGTRSPWKPDWDVVLGLAQPSCHDAPGHEEDTEDLIPAQRYVRPPGKHYSTALPPPTAATEIEPDNQHISGYIPIRSYQAAKLPSELQLTGTPWLFRGPDIPALLDKMSRMLAPSTALREHISALRTKKELGPLEKSVSGEDLLKGALVMIKMILCGRGSPEDLANIYPMNDDDVKQWFRMQAWRRTGTAHVDDSDEAEVRAVHLLDMLI